MSQLSAVCSSKEKCLISVADPGFSFVGGTNYQSGCANLLFYKFFAEKNCMKMKEFGPRGSSLATPPPGSANAFGIMTRICLV